MTYNKVGIKKLPNTHNAQSEIKRLKHEISVLQKRIANPVQQDESVLKLEIKHLNDKVSSLKGIITGFRNRLSAYENGAQNCLTCKLPYTPRVSKFCRACRDSDTCKKKKVYKKEFTGKLVLFVHKVLQLVPQKWRLYKCINCPYWHITSSQNPLHNNELIEDSLEKSNIINP